MYIYIFIKTYLHMCVYTPYIYFYIHSYIVYIYTVYVYIFGAVPINHFSRGHLFTLCFFDHNVLYKDIDFSARSVSYVESINSQAVTDAFLPKYSHTSLMSQLLRTKENGV